MRISDMERNRSFTQGIEQRLINLNRVQEEVATGRSLFTPSEGVSRADQALTSRDALAADSQFLRNIADSQTWVDSADTRLQAVTDLISQINSLATTADNDSETADDRHNIAVQINQKLESLMSLVNAKSGDRYLFGGYGTTASPFTAVRNSDGQIESVTTNPATIAGKIYRRIGDGDDIQINLSGAGLFQPNGSQGTDGDLFYVVAALRDTIGNNNTPPEGYEDSRSTQHLQDQLSVIGKRITEQQAYLGSVGQRLEATKSRLQERDISLTNSLDDAQGIDMPSLVTRLSTEQAAYSALASMSQKMLGQSLVNYLQ